MKEKKKKNMKRKNDLIYSIVGVV